MHKYSKKILDIDIDDLPFMDFQSARYSMTARVNIKETYDFSKNNNYSFFNLTLGAMIKAIDEIPEFKRRIIDNKVYEFDCIKAVCPILREDGSIFEIAIDNPCFFNDFPEWMEYVDIKKQREDLAFMETVQQRDLEPIVNFSCIPWVNFDAMTNIQGWPTQIMPVISWGKMADGKISVAVSASHIFVFGYQFKQFYETLNKYLSNPNLLFE